MSGAQIAEILSDVLGRKIRYDSKFPEDLADIVSKIPSAGTRLYMESAVQRIREAVAGRMTFQRNERDDVQTVFGRPGTTIREWAEARAAVSD